MISIITATLNAAETLSDNLTCIQLQIESQADEGQIEHILIDGGSTDTTLQIAKKQGGHISTILSEPDQGMYDAMNKGIRLAKGDIIGILNADDVYVASDVLEKVAKVFKDPEIDACYGDLCYVKDSPDKEIVRYWKSGSFHPNKFYWGWMPPHPTFFVRRKVYEQFGLFNLDLGTAADYEIMLRFLLKHNLKAAYIPQVLVHMRTGGASNVTVKSRLKANKNDRQAWRVNGLKPYPWTLMAKPVRKIGQWITRY
jgi:glycosyltransferase involved in cell wall biosynthesis